MCVSNLLSSHYGLTATKFLLCTNNLTKVGLYFFFLDKIVGMHLLHISQIQFIILNKINIIISSTQPKIIGHEPLTDIYPQNK